MYSEFACYVSSRGLCPSHLTSKPRSSVLASSIKCLSGLMLMRWPLVTCSETCGVLAIRKLLHLGARLVHSMRVSPVLIHELVRHLPPLLFLHQVLLYAHHWLHIRALRQVLTMLLQELWLGNSNWWLLVCEPSVITEWMSSLRVSLIARIVALSFIVEE